MTVIIKFLLSKKATHKFGLLLFSICLSTCNFAQEKSFEVMVDTLLSHTVDEVTVEEASTDSVSVFLDAREKNEFEVSHIEGAQWIGYNDFDSTRVADLDKSTPIVVYCSVGYRSEKISEQLIDMGFENVSNLYGGIFDWSNKEKPLVKKKDKPTDKVHPYDENWGQWVEEEKRSYK